MGAPVIAQFIFAAMLPVAACVLLALLRRLPNVARIPEAAWQAIVGVVFGAIAIYGNEAGIPVDGALMNVRDAAPLAAGLFFSGPAGIIAGVIGGVERWIAVMWGAEEFTRIACSLGTVFAGVYAALLRKYIFENRMPMWPMAFATGVVVEVLHLLLIPLTNFDQISKAIEVAQACALPMIGAVGISTGLSALALAVLSRQRMFVPKDEREIAQIVQSRLLVAVVVAFLVTVSFMGVVQTSLSRTETSELLKLNIDDVEQGILEASNANGSDDRLSQVESAVSNRHVGLSGELIVVDNAGVFACSRGDVEKDAADRPVADAAKAAEGQLFSTSFMGEDCLASYGNVGDFRVIALLPAAEADYSRDVSLLIISFMEVLILAAVFVALYFAIKRVVVRSIQRVNGRLGQITQGDLDVEIDVRESMEFASLSDDINKTVGVLKESIATVQADLDMASDIQANTLPDISRALPPHDEFKLFASMKPAKEVGGDFYDFFMVDDDHVALVVADVSGKGVPAALFMMRSKTVIKMKTLSGLPPDKVLIEANCDLADKNDDSMFTTVWLGILEISSGRLVYADAGHEKLALYRNGSWEIPSKPNGAVALGVYSREDYGDLSERYRFRNHVMMLQPGDAVFQYTDGVTEATDVDDEAFGEGRLLCALNEADDISPEMLLPFVRERVDAFAKGAPQFDDLTMLGLLYEGLAVGDL